MQDYLNGVARVFGVLFDIDSPDGHLYSNLTNGKEREYPLLSSRFHVGGEAALSINIYHPGGDQGAMAEAERHIKAKLDDFLEKFALTDELLANYDKLNLYRGLAEQMLQAEDRAGALDMLLEGLEMLVKAGWCGLLTVTSEKGVLELSASRGHGGGRGKTGTRYRYGGTMLERVADKLSSYCFYESVSETIPGVEGPDIVIKGPFLAAPVLTRHPGAPPELKGVIYAFEPLEGSFTNKDQHSVATVASLASVALVHFREMETTRRATKEMDTMLSELMATFTSLQRQSALIEQVNRISVRINATLDLGVIFNSIADYSHSLLESAHAIVAVMGSGSRVSFPGLAGVPRDQAPAVALPEESILARAFLSPRHIIINGFDPRKYELGFNPPFAVRNLIAHPIESKNAIVAVILAFNKSDGEDFVDQDADLLKALAYQATTAIENARLINNLKQTQFTMMAKLSELAEKRDPETGEHLLRMRKYCRIIAAELAKTEKYRALINDQYINEIYAASPLHDIGKVAISDAVLLKRGKLNGDEWEHMMTHAAVGEGILRGPDYLKTAADIAGAHHEKWDGSGYPRGLKGDAIPLSARIVAVADVYDALTSKRVYKEDMSHELAMEIINDGVGRHFDPEVIDAFKKAVKEIITIKNLIR